MFSLEIIETLMEMNKKLEEIQKSLETYLETKRVSFPRFYFVSNDDLLEILGQSKNPDAIQPHMKKCFDNIKSLKLEKVWHVLNSEKYVEIPILISEQIILIKIIRFN